MDLFSVDSRARRACRLIDARYLIFKVTVAFWQYFDNDIRSARQADRAYKK
jgi:hypothetical protein